MLSNVLYSRPGGQAQVLHREDNANDGTRDYVMSCIVALQEKTTLEFANTLFSETRDTKLSTTWGLSLLTTLSTPGLMAVS